MKIQYVILSILTACTFVLLIVAILLTIANPDKADVLGFIIAISVIVLTAEMLVILWEVKR